MARAEPVRRYLAALDRTQIVEAARQNHPLWGGDRSPAEHAAYTLGQLEIAGPELMRYVGLVDGRGRLVGALKRYSLPFRDGRGDALRAVGIGAVFTRPAAHGQGVASALLRAVMGEARDLGYAAALLYSDIDPGYYARLGFVALPARDWTVSRPTSPEAARSPYGAPGSAMKSASSPGTTKRGGERTPRSCVRSARPRCGDTSASATASAASGSCAGAGATRGT